MEDKPNKAERPKLITLTDPQRINLQKCIEADHELKEQNGWVHCLTEDLVIGQTSSSTPPPATSQTDSARDPEAK